MAKSKIIALYLSGVLAGIFIAQGLFILAGRVGGTFGGEMFIMPLIICSIVMGVFIGRMFPEQYKNKYRYRGRNLK